MKKKLSMLLVVVMVLAMSVPVFAATSPTAKTNTTSQTKASTATATATSTASTAAPSAVTGISGSSISDPSGALPKGSTLSSAEVTSGEVYEAAAAMAKAQIKGLTDFRVIDFDLKSGATVVHQLDGTVTITVPVPSGLNVPAGKTIVVYRCDEGGVLTKCDTIVQNGNVVFATNHFSTYIFAVTDAASATSKSSPKTAENSMSTIMLLIAAASLAGVAVVSKKRMHN